MIRNYFFSKRTLFFAVFLLFCQTLFSETIILRNGNVKKGRIVSQDKLSLVFEEKEGAEQEVFSKKEILKVSYKDLTQAEINQILKESGGPELVNVSPGSPVADPIGGRKSITRGKAFLRSTALPGWGQMYQNRQIAGTAYFLFFLGGIGFAAHQYKEFKSENRDYDFRSNNYFFALAFQDSNAQYLARIEMQSQKAQMDRALHRAEIAAGVLAGVYLLNLFDVVIFHPKDNLSLRASAYTDQMSIKLEFRF
ncbi:MAG: hypothetical protein KBA66_00300 [Leptospiraceae bacterium]|nr:hypothetical protein [Leptospiraceae bacterium]